MLKEIALTDYYFKELIKTRRDYLLLLINGICKLDLKEEDITFGDTEERDSVTFKTISYDIKVVSKDINLDIEAQKNIVDKEKNENGEYSYDINRAIYYLSMLHSRSYEYNEKGYTNKKSIVIFIYLYDIPGDDAIQKINLHNNSTNIEYDNIVYYSVSLAKISKDSKIELERALKLLSEKDIDSYKKDESKVIKEAAEMIEGYSESEIAAMIRDAKKREEFERGYQRELDRKEARAEGLAEGKTQGLAEGRTQGLAEGRTQGLAEGRTQGLAEGRTQGLTEGRVEGAKQNLESNIKIMYTNGFDIDTIAKALSLDVNYVKEVLNK